MDAVGSEARMVENGFVGGCLGAAADALEERFGEIFAAYEGRLSAVGSPLMAGGAAAREQLEAQARRVLEDAARDLRWRGGPPSGADGRSGALFEGREAREDELSAALGVSRAREGVHPIESLRAVVALFEAAIEAVVDDPVCSGLSARETAAVALAVQRSIMERVTRGSASYGYYLLGKLHESQADERRRISRELHDRVAHSIVVFFRNLELHEMYADKKDSQRAKEKLELAKRTAQDALRSTRELSSELRRTSVEGGLEVALSDYLRAAAPRGVEARVSAKGDESQIALELRDQLFLILREAARNALAHSGARTIRVGFSVAEDRFEASIEDDGRGFEPEEVTTRSGGGTGLASMKERASLLGGALALESLPGKGTRIELSVPLPKAARDLRA